jgi:hypothetical protein
MVVSAFYQYLAPLVLLGIAPEVLNIGNNHYHLNLTAPEGAIFYKNNLISNINACRILFYVISN